MNRTLRSEAEEFKEFEEFRSSGVQEFRSSGVQEFRSSGVQGGCPVRIASQNSSERASDTLSSVRPLMPS
jgi:hypothetical protein